MMEEGCWVRISVIICAPDRKVRVRAGGRRPLGVTHPWLLTAWLGIWVGPAELNPGGFRLPAHTREADPAGPEDSLTKGETPSHAFLLWGMRWGSRGAKHRPRQLLPPSLPRLCARGASQPCPACPGAAVSWLLSGVQLGDVTCSAWDLAQCT